jgi:hypothetical protein
LESEKQRKISRNRLYLLRGHAAKTMNQDGSKSPRGRSFSGGRCVDHHNVRGRINRDEDRGLAFLYSLPFVGGNQPFWDFREGIGELQQKLKSVRNVQGEEIIANRLEGGRQGCHGVAHG